MTFSITIPAYKSQFFKEAIESVVSQTYSDWELIIVDDCSPEDLRSIVEPFLDDKRIHYYRNEKNCGAIEVVDNWNICLNYCTGDYVICMGDDDRLLPRCLEEYKKLIEKYPGLNAYHTRTEIIDQNGVTVFLQEPRPEWESALSLVWNRWAYRYKQFIGDFCYNTNYLRHVGGYCKQPLAWGSDDMTAAMASKDFGIANTQTFGFQYRENPLTISNSSKNAKIKIDATLLHYQWFSSFIHDIEGRELTPSDLRYLQTIEHPRTKFFQMILNIYCSQYIKGNPLRLIHCCKRLKGMPLSRIDYVKWYITSLYYLFVH